MSDERSTGLTPTAPLDLGPTGERAQRVLVVALEGEASTYVLPARGALIIGRGTDAEVVVDHESVSRRHARLHVGETLLIEDLGSVNGTVLNGRRLEPREPTAIGINDGIDLGAAKLSVQLRARQSAGNILTARHFMGTLERTWARALEHGREFALLRIEIESSAPPRICQAALATELGPGDLLAMFGPQEYRILVGEHAAADADRLAQRIREALAGANLSAQTQVARFPSDGRDLASLFERLGDREIFDQQADPHPSILIHDPAMVKLFEVAARVSKSDLNVLLHGETGSGKEVVADYIQSQSGRAPKPFVKLNCAALTESLLESELFGHAKGAFTGATHDKMGLLVSANGGMVFLDEVGELPLATQAKLLRVVEDNEVMPVGAVKPRSADVRFISATNRDLQQMVREGSFRQDLLFRLNGMTFVVPPLRERPLDIEALAWRFLQDVWARNAKHPPQISEEAMSILRAHHWPGNVRELRNAIERAVVLAGDSVITPEHLSLSASAVGAKKPVAQQRLRGSEPVEPSGPPTEPLLQEVQQLERRRIVEALAECAGNQTQAAKKLGLSRASLVRKLDQYDIPRPRRERKG